MGNTRFRKGHGKSSQVSPVPRLTEASRGLLVRILAYKCSFSHPQEGIKCFHFLIFYFLN